MKRRDSVFELIQSLSKGEKRNFKLLSQITAGDKKYVQLFEVLEKQEEYDEERILNHFKDDPVFLRQYSYNKNYLYNALLNSLSYHDKSQASSLYQLINQIRNLYDKDQAIPARKLLRKAMNTADSGEHFEEKLILLELAYKVHQKLTPLHKIKEAYQQLELQEKLTLEKLNNLKAYQRLRKKLKIIYQLRNVVRNEEEEQQINAIAEHGLLEGHEAALSGRARLEYFQIKRKIALLRQSHTEAMELAEKAVSLAESNEEFLHYYRDEYSQLLIGLASHYNRVGKTDQALKLIKKFHSVEPRNQREQNQRFYYYFVFVVGQQITYGIREELQGDLKQLEQTLMKGKHSLPNNMLQTLYFILGQYSFMKGNFATAQQWISKFLALNSTHRVDIHALARILYLLILLENGELYGLEAEIKKVSRWLEASNRKFEFERMMIGFVQRAMQIGPQWAEDRDLIQQCQKEWEKIRENGFERSVEELFYVSDYFNSKQKGQTMFEYRPKYEEKAIALKED